MTTPTDLLDSIALAAFECGFGHCHLVSTAGVVTTDTEVSSAEAFRIVSGWQYVGCSHLPIVASDDAVTWLYWQCDAQGEPASEVVQFVSLKPERIRSRQALH